MHVSHSEPLKKFCHCVCYVRYLSWLFLMKQKMTCPFLAALCIVNMKSIPALAILRKVIVFSFSISLSAFSRLLCQFQASWQMAEEGGPSAIQLSSYLGLEVQQVHKDIWYSQNPLGFLWTRPGKKVCREGSNNTGHHRDALKLIFLQKIQTWLLDHTPIILTC